jgi:hypothetical protein
MASRALGLVFREGRNLHCEDDNKAFLKCRSSWLNIIFKKVNKFKKIRSFYTMNINKCSLHTKNLWKKHI